MAKMSGGELLLRCLAREGVRYVFGVPGGQLLTFLDAIKRLGDELNIEFVGCRHEQAAANMADAYARLTGQPAVCVGTVGPGGANLVPGVYPAWADGIPMIVITAQNQTWKSYPDHGCMQALDQFHLFKPITKWNAVVSHWERIPELVERAFKIALSGRQGPVHLDLPSNVLFEKKEASAVKLFPPTRYRAVHPPAGNSEAVERAAELLANAENPLIYAGGGVLRAKAWNELRELAEYIGAAVTTSFSAKGVIPEDHKLALIAASPGAIMAQTNADVVLIAGSRMGDLSFWGKPPMWGDPDAQKTIQIDIEPENIALNRPIDVAIVGDAKIVLKQLLNTVKKRTDRKEPSEKLKTYKAAQEAWQKEYLRQAESDEKPIHPLRLMKEVREFYPRDAIAVFDGGNTPVWAHYVHRIYEPNTYIWAADSGHLGVGLPYAIAAKLASPQKKVYLVTGDGAFGTAIQELETAYRLGVKVTVIVVNDQAWGMIKGSQKLSFGERYVGVDFSDMKYAEVAAAAGWYAERIEDPAEIKPALERAEKADKPALIDVIVSQEAHLTPPDLTVLNAVWLEGCEPP